jgi:hypothetical protein
MSTDRKQSYETRKSNLDSRNAAIIAEVDKLYKVELIRFDIIKDRMCKEYFISARTFDRIMKRPQ